MHKQLDADEQTQVPSKQSTNVFGLDNCWYTLSGMRSSQGPLNLLHKGHLFIEDIFIVSQMSVYNKDAPP